MLAHDYCQELTGAVCLDSIKLELLNETTLMRRRAYLLPRDSMVHKIPVARTGEHQYANYRELEEDETQKIVLYDQNLKKIVNFWAIPSFDEILNINDGWENFKDMNLANLYKYDLGDPTGEVVENKVVFANNDQIGLFRKSTPSL